MTKRLTKPSWSGFSREALDLPPAERSSFLAEATDDAGLAREVEKLLQAEEGLERFGPRWALDETCETLAEPYANRSDGPGTGSQLGAFTLLRELGRGGMGTVYLAEQEEPIHRRVAVKVIDRPLFDDQARRRFEAERSALARLSHVNIAALFEAGTAADGTPFFAMELADGPPITSYCDSEGLDLRKRLLLFRAVCLGVAHAHQKGVLHRDLKPSNILLVESNGRAEPKIIDFGIAKALDRPLIERTLETGRHLLGTPAFMSPEAVDSSDLVDTRSDVYALGVLLYELVAGVRPLGEPNDNPLRMMRRIAEEDPPALLERLAGAEPS